MDEQTSFETRAVIGPRRAGLNRIAIAIPVLALGAMVWFGLSGTSPALNPANGSPPPTRAPDALESGRQAPSYPATAFGIEVRTVGDVARADVGAEAVTAVAGWYVAWPNLGCFIADATEPPGILANLGVNADVRTFCDRSGALTAAPTVPRQRAGASPGLYVVLAPGLVVPPQMNVPDGPPIEVVLVGRVVAMRHPTDQVTTDRQFLVDGVAWANGEPFAPTTAILPKLLDQEPNLPPGPRDALAEAIIGPTGTVLIEALVDPPTLDFVDPDAAALVADTSPKSERIWYRLALGLQPDRIAPRWIAIDDTTAAVIGTGILGNPSVIVVDGSGAPATAAPGPRLPLDGTNVMN
jgi:hypothetical protein